MQLAQHTENDLNSEPPESSALITLIAFESRAAAVSEWVSKVAHAASHAGISADADLLKRCEMQLECILSTLRSPPSEPTFRSGTNDLSPDVPATPSASLR
jgi:hypothetical protein